MPVRRGSTIPSAEDYAASTEAFVHSGEMILPASTALEPEDENEVPLHGVVEEGWDAAEKLKTSGSAYAQDFKFSETEVLGVFLEDKPFAVYSQHWVTREGKQSFTCITPALSCPLCAAGVRADKKYAFNLAVVGDSGDVELKSLTAGNKLMEQLKALNSSRRGPLSAGYWSVSRNGDRKKGYTYSFFPVTGEELGRAWDIDQADLDAEVAKLVPYDKTIVDRQDITKLREIADELP